MIGPGKYDELCTLVRERANAKGALLVVIEGNRGQGFSVQATGPVLAVLPELLETLAREIRRDIEQGKP